MRCSNRRPWNVDENQWPVPGEMCIIHNGIVFFFWKQYLQAYGIPVSILLLFRQDSENWNKQARTMKWDFKKTKKTQTVPLLLDKVWTTFNCWDYKQWATKPSTHLKGVCALSLSLSPPSPVTLKNAAELLEFASMYNADQLKLSCQQFIVLNMAALLESRWGWAYTHVHFLLKWNCVFLCASGFVALPFVMVMCVFVVFQGVGCSERWCVGGAVCSLQKNGQFTSKPKHMQPCAHTTDTHVKQTYP